MQDKSWEIKWKVLSGEKITTICISLLILGLGN